MILSKNLIQKPVIWQIRKLTLYCLYSFGAIFQFKKPTLIYDSVVYFHLWWKYYKRNPNPLNYDRPWIVFKAKEYLDTILNKKMTVFEYGSGSSTLYFSRRVSKIYSVENDKEWYAHLSTKLQEMNITNIDYTLIEGIKANSSDLFYNSLSSIYNDYNFENYVKSIDNYNDESFDMVVVDGRARKACVAHAVAKVKKGGFLLVDNSDRKQYFDGNEFLFDTTKWKAIHFIGPVPYSFEFSKTSFFQKL